MFESRDKRAFAASALAVALTFFPATVKAELLAVGVAAPGFTLPSQENRPVALSDYKGQWVVLYFYPKDQTSGCTLEAHNFQRDLARYADLHAVVLGVSLDTVESHKTFCTKDSLTFKLLADPNHRVIDAYGVPIHSSGALRFAERTTFLISPRGTIAREWTVSNISSHSAEVLGTLHALEHR